MGQNYLRFRRWNSIERRNIRRPVSKNADGSGIFPEDSLILEKFAQIMRETIEEVDILMHWQKNYEAYFINRYGKKIQRILKSNIHTAWIQQYP